MKEKKNKPILATELNKTECEQWLKDIKDTKEWLKTCDRDEDFKNLFTNILIINEKNVKHRLKLLTKQKQGRDVKP